MGSIEIDQISQGREDVREPRRRNVVLLLRGSAVVALLLLGWLTLHGSSETARQVPVVVPPSRTDEPAPPTAVATPVPPQLSIGDICPAKTNHRTSLEVSFILRNPTGAPARVDGVVPDLPLNGLTTLGSTLSRGTCAKPVRGPAQKVIAPGESLLVSLRFRLPRDCPAPYPIAVSLRFRSAGWNMEQNAALYNDLGSIHFVSCST